MSSDEEEYNEGSRFVKRPKKPITINSRPRSVSGLSQIISNPKLVKSLQNLDQCSKTGLKSGRGSTALIDNKGSSQNRFEEVDFEIDEGRDEVLQNGQQLGTSDSDGDKKSWYSKYLGITLGLFASFVFSLGSIIVKSISDIYHPYTLSLWTFIGIGLPSFLLLLIKCCFKKDSVFSGILPLNNKDHIRNFLLIVIRALCGAGGTVLKVYSLQYMTAADSTIISFTSPVFVLIIAWIFLKEKCGAVPIITAIIVLLGVGFITRPPWITGEKGFDLELLTGCAMAFGCMLMGAFVVVILRYVSKVDFAFITFVYGLLGAAGSIGLCLWVGRLEAPNCLKHWLFAISFAALTFIGQTTLTISLQYEQATLIGLVRPSEIVFIFLWQIIFLNKIPDWLSLIGALVVVFGLSIITLRKWISTLPTTNSTRKMCNLLLL